MKLVLYPPKLSIWTATALRFVPFLKKFHVPHVPYITKNCILLTLLTIGANQYFFNKRKMGYYAQNAVICAEFSIRKLEN